MRRQEQTQIRPALTLSEKVQIVLNSHMSNRDKIDCIVTLTESEIEERNINLNRKKIRKQIMSEVLYLFEKIEKNQKLKQNRNYIWKRINLIWRNCLQTGWLMPVEEGCDYLENLALAKENIQRNQVVVREEKRNIMAIPAKIIVSGVEPFNLAIPRMKKEEIRAQIKALPAI